MLSACRAIAGPLAASARAVAISPGAVSVLAQRWLSAPASSPSVKGVVFDLGGVVYGTSLHASQMSAHPRGVSIP